MIGASALYHVCNTYIMYIVAMRLTSVDLSAVLQFEHSTGVATISSVAQDQMQSGNARSKQVTRDAYRPPNRLRMATRRALEWIGMLWKKIQLF